MFKSLIIDDEKPVQIAISKLGKWNHYHIKTPETAGNGEQGLKIMREIHPSIVFVDMNMPIMDGCSFLNIASKEFPECKFIVVSGYDSFAYAHQALRCGAIDYLLKPIEEDTLNAAIEKALAQLNPNTAPSDTDPFEELSPNDIVVEIRKYIESNYCQNFKISVFEEKYHFSSAYLTKLFRSAYGYSIYEYVLKLRMERALELLENPEIKVLSIAERLGYTDNHYFSKAFKTYYGMSPSQYRNDYLQSLELKVPQSPSRQPSVNDMNNSFR